MDTRPKRLMRGLLLLIAALALATMAPMAPPQPGKSVLFRDTFSDGNDDGWMPVNRYWRVTNGWYLCDSDYRPNSIGRNGYSVTHAADKTWKNYVFQATFDNRNPGGYPEDVNQAEFLVRVLTPPPFGSWWNGTGHGTFYAIGLWPRGTPDPRIGDPLPDGLVQLSKFVNGLQTAYAEREYSNTNVGINKILIKVAGRTLRVVVNGQEVLVWKDPGQPIPYGGIGVGAIWEVQAAFDNVLVTRGPMAKK